MQGPSHLLLSWYFADASALERPRDRAIVAWAGLAPDVEVLAYAGALLYYRLDKDLAFENVWQVVHRKYTHGLTFVLLTVLVAYFLSQRKWRVALLAGAASVLHNFCDVIGGGATWPIYPYWPLSPQPWSASWSWTIGEWPNLALLAVLLAGMFAYARWAGRSPFECFGSRVDAWFVRTVRNEKRASTSSGLRWIIWAAVALTCVAILAPLGFQVSG